MSEITQSRTVQRGSFATMCAHTQPTPTPCDACLVAWEVKAARMGFPFETALSQLPLPEFNPQCPTCVADFQAEIDTTRAYRDALSHARTR
jgi:hypothetical protein